ncbi:hypothetical protein DICVIV_08880 [Dictyocaulus viviparus]|uniref:G-protein coupled receptors family 1 profile domain-containing protein n=1 Tax=Dictyocaulus viviparus TaxID=29172 RepID=A0A0D8XKB6_DICVI|nr:hypothetical protein DICVIV_08880 [Dictyocaulus viviparus]
MYLEQQLKPYEWFLPKSLCQIVPYTETVSLSVSVFTLTASAVHEFRTVFFSKNRRLGNRSVRSFVVIIWVIAVVVSLPHGLFHKVYDIQDGNLIISQVFARGEANIEKLSSVDVFARGEANMEKLSSVDGMFEWKTHKPHGTWELSCRCLYRKPLILYTTPHFSASSTDFMSCDTTSKM